MFKARFILILRISFINYIFLGQRTKELSYSLRLCHLNASTNDGTPVSTFGFEISENPPYEYPTISRVEPKLAGDSSGLQTNDILIKVNNRKTKGLDFDKIKKLIEKAKRDGRLEMLVADKDTFDYCIKTNRKLKESYIKVKHIFPRSRSTTNFSKLPTLARASQSSIEGLDHGISFDIQRMSIREEVLSESDLNSPTFDGIPDSNLTSPVSTSNTTTTFFPSEPSPVSANSRRKSSQRRDTSSTIKNISKTTQGMQNDESFVDAILNAITHFFNNLGTDNTTQRL